MSVRIVMTTITNPCAAPDCFLDGLYPAPDGNGGYIHFCLIHVRAYNKQWDYFKGMNDAQVAAWLKANDTWHLPTWPLGQRTASPKPAAQASLPAAVENALAHFRLTPPIVWDVVKKTYYATAKKLQPLAQAEQQDAIRALQHANDAWAVLKKHRQLFS